MPCREEQRLRLQLDQLTLQVGHWLVGNLEGVKNFEGKPMNDTRRLNQNRPASLSRMFLSNQNVRKKDIDVPVVFNGVFLTPLSEKSFSSVFTLPEISKARENRPSP